MATEKFGNNPESTLNGAINDSTTSVVVDNGAAYTSPNFRVNVNDELMLVTGKATNTLTVQRGAEGTTPATHIDESRVRQVLTTGALSQRVSDNVSIGVIAARPTIERAGQLYIATDLSAVFYSNGSNWLPFGFIDILTNPPTTGWSWLVQNGANVSAVDRGIELSQSGAPSNSGVYVRSLTYSAPYHIIFGVINNIRPRGNCLWHILLNKTGGNSYVLSFNSFEEDLRAQKWTNTWTFDSQYLITNNIDDISLNAIQWYRFLNDGTNVSISLSNDKQNWIELHTTTTNTAFGSSVQPDRLGFGLRSSDGSNSFNSYFILASLEEVDDS